MAIKKRNWILRKTILAPARRQVWRFIWDRAMGRITPDRKTQVNPDGSFLDEYKAWVYDFDDHGNRYKNGDYAIHKHAKNTMGHDRGRQATLGRALGYAVNAKRRFGRADPGMGPYSGWHKGSKPQGDRATRLLDIAGFDSFSHAMFTWAGAGKKHSPVWMKEPVKKLYNKDLIFLAENNIEKHLGDECDGDSTPEQIYEEAFILALDALCDANCNEFRAKRIANLVCKGYEKAL